MTKPFVEDFLTGLFATWLAMERGEDTPPRAGEKKRAREAAQKAVEVLWPTESIAGELLLDTGIE